MNLTRDLQSNRFEEASFRTKARGSDWLHMLHNLCAFVGPFFAYRVSGRVSPVLAGYKITHRCNLSCTHCPYWRRTGGEQDFGGVLSTLNRLSRMGVRILILEGGEPLLWRDRKMEIRHVIDAARTLFRSVCMTTNGTLPWKHLPLDTVWVSLDGTRAVHDSIRGAGVFDKVMNNLETEGKGHAYISTTINSLNVESVPAMVRELKGLTAGVTIQFHYPYQGLPDPLFIPPADRGEVLDELIHLKRAGYPVANSFDSLNDLKKERWTCEDKLLANAEPDGAVMHGCYLKNRGPSQCNLCGFAAHNEMSLAFKGGMQSILTGLKIFFRQKS